MLVGLGFSGRCEPLKWREEPTKARKTCRFCNARSFSGGHFQGPLDFLDFRLLGTAQDLGFLGFLGIRILGFFGA